MSFSTEQETFWQGDFGDEYTSRNTGSNLVAANTALFVQVLSRTRDVKTVLELGSNIGLNLVAIRSLLPDSQLSAVEINQTAGNELLQRLPAVDLHRTSILEFVPATRWDFVFTKGVLIHINPSVLPAVYDLMFEASGKYILVAEYYNPTPVEVEYRGYSDRLFKRDFAGEMLDRFPALRLLDYGFAYHRDANFPEDDTNWFLMEKT